jgi:hypothetical protein
VYTYKKKGDDDEDISQEFEMYRYANFKEKNFKSDLIMYRNAAPMRDVSDV